MRWSVWAAFQREMKYVGRLLLQLQFIRNRLYLVISVFFALLACMTFQSASTPQAIAPLRKIVFVTEQDGNREIYIMRSDGSEQTRLTNNPADETGPLWSPDGKKIAFVSDRDGNEEIYLMNADGSGQVRVTHTTIDNYIYSAWAWSPGGTKITFALGMFTADAVNSTIYVVNTDGTGLTQLTDNQESNHSPDWSPNGNLISFVSERDGNPEIYVMNINGSNQVRLTNSELQDYSQVWSPDSTQIAFTSYRDGNGEVYIVKADGSSQYRITDNEEEDYPLAWLKSGEAITLRVPHDSIEGDVYSITPGNSKQTLLARIDLDGPEVVSPDGKQVAFLTAKDGDFEIYVVDFQSSARLRLTNNSAGDYGPAWQP